MTGLDIPDWTAPWPTRGEQEFVRVSASHLRGDSRWECPTQIAAKARPSLRQQRDPSLRIEYSPYASFPLGIARDAIFEVLSSGATLEEALTRSISAVTGAVPDEMREVARAGLNGYLMALARLRESGALPADTVVREFFAYDDSIEPAKRDGIAGSTAGHSDVTRIEWSAWGILHVSADSRVREFHVLSWDDAGRRPKPDAFLAVCARVAADAVARMPGSSWFQAWEAAPHQPRAGTEVHIREIGLLDASDALLLTMPLSDVLDRFPEIVAPQVPVLGGGAFNPSGRCASCAFRHHCPGIARMPGVWGVAGPAAPFTRALAPNDLSAGAVCTWQIHLQRDLNLPSASRASTSAMQRGTAIHQWLEAAHGRMSGCSAEDLPFDSLGDVAEGLGWSEDTYMSVRPYLQQHLETCPLRRADVIAAYPEQSLTAWDTDVDVVMSTRTDLVVEFPEGVVVRETKSKGSMGTPETDAEVFERYPQVALALTMLGDGLDPITGEVAAHSHPQRAAYVELELLTPDDHDVLRFDARDGETVLQARTTIAQSVDHILYSSPAPHPGHWCSWCPVAPWCASRSDATVPDDAEVAAVAAADAPRMSLLAYSETPISADDEIPF